MASWYSSMNHIQVFIYHKASKSTHEHTGWRVGVFIPHQVRTILYVCTMISCACSSNKNDAKRTVMLKLFQLDIICPITVSQDNPRLTVAGRNILTARAFSGWYKTMNKVFTLLSYCFQFISKSQVASDSRLVSLTAVFCVESNNLIFFLSIHHASAMIFS